MRVKWVNPHVECLRQWDSGSISVSYYPWIFWEHRKRRNRSELEIG